MDADRMRDILKLLNEKLSEEIAAIRRTDEFQTEEALETGTSASVLIAYKETLQGPKHSILSRTCSTRWKHGK